MRKLFPFIAALLVYAFTPGMCEVAEIAIHFASTGDLHASDEERHSEHGDSEGEDGECHTCFCHAPTAFVAATPTAAPGVALPDGELRLVAPDDVACDGEISELFRPPIA